MKLRIKIERMPSVIEGFFSQKTVRDCVPLADLSLSEFMGVIRSRGCFLGKALRRITPEHVQARIFDGRKTVF